MNIKNILNLSIFSKDDKSTEPSLSELYELYKEGQIDINEKRFNDRDNHNNKLTLYECSPTNLAL